MMVHKTERCAGMGKKKINLKEISWSNSPHTIPCLSQKKRKNDWNSIKKSTRIL